MALLVRIMPVLEVNVRGLTWLLIRFPSTSVSMQSQPRTVGAQAGMQSRTLHGLCPRASSDAAERPPCWPPLWRALLRKQYKHPQDSSVVRLLCACKIMSHCQPSRRRYFTRHASTQLRVGLGLLASSEFLQLWLYCMQP